MHIVEKILRRQGLGFVAEAGKVSNDEERNLLSQNMLPTLNGKIIISTDERTSEELTKIIKLLVKMHSKIE